MSGGVPVWLCRWPGRPSRYVTANDSAAARNACERKGWGRPPENTRERSWVTFAGYRAVPPGVSAPPRAPKKNQPKLTASGRRVEHALTVYGLLRLDWPIGSVLAAAGAAARWQSSASALRDFVANVGSALERIEAPTKTLEAVVEAEAMAWWWSAREKNLRRRGLQTESDWAKDKRELFRGRARRLRKRASYAVAVGELAGALNGTLVGDEIAAENLRLHLVDNGVSREDAELIAGRWCRVSIPRW